MDKNISVIKKSKLDKNIVVPKRTKLFMQEIQKLIYKWYMDGWSKKMVVDELMANYGFKTVTNCRKIINKVNVSFRDHTNDDIEELKNKYLEMYNNLYMRAIQNNDIRAANDILNNVIKLQGLIVNKVEGNITTTFDVKF